MIRFTDLSLRTKLLSLFLLVGLTPTAILAWRTTTEADSALTAASSAAGEALEAAAVNQLVALRDVKRGRVEAYFDETRQDMEVLVETVDTLRSEAFRKLTAVREVKRQAVERYFKTIEDQVRSFSEDRMVVRAMRGFQEGFHAFRETQGVDSAELGEMRAELGSYYRDQFGAEYRRQNETAPQVDSIVAGLPDDTVALQYQYIASNPNPLGSKHELDRAEDGSDYSELHGEVHPVIRDFLKRFGYYDIFLADLETGEIVYSVFKELDYATSLLDGPYADTNFAEAFRLARKAKSPDEVFLVDYARYKPSYEAPASFIASPIFDGGERIGVALFQMPIDGLNEIMGQRAGLGRTGETYLVGADGLMRSDSFLAPDTHSVAASFRRPETGRVDTDGSRAALSGNADTRVILDYNGNPVLSAWTPVELCGLTWALLAEIDVAEAFCPKVDGAEKDYFASYKECHGYYDLFLVNPDGYCFYTVEHERDYQTNLITGKFSGSNLGRLIVEVIETGKLGFADFEPYAPSDGVPAAFLAQPVISGGQTVLVVALQMPLAEIDAIMTERSGMGETGETYLVGPDKLMRSDSYLDPDGHSVEASFRSPSTGSVETEASLAALGGELGEKIIDDYNGNPVLSAYAPLDVFGVRWALLAETDVAEALAVADEMRADATEARTAMLVATGITGAIACILIVLVAILMATVITKPINKTVAMLRNISEGDGDLTQRLVVSSKDEIGHLSRYFNAFVDKIHGVVQIIGGSAESLVLSADEMSRVSLSLASGSETVSARSSAASEGTLEASESVSTVASGVEEVSASATSVASATEEVTASLNAVGAAAEEMSSTMTTVAATTEQVSSAVNAVAASIEEMLSSLSDVGQNTTKSAQVAQRATQLAGNASGRVNSLGESANEIGKVVEMIQSIAAQTNLLAINATIEAASAGDAGKGFAVVANEVKELAAQTAEATEVIRRQVEKMQGNTTGTIDAIGEITGVIDEVDEIASLIAAAVEQQTATTAEIARNVSDAAEGVKQASESVKAVATAATGVSQNVQEAVCGANEVARSVAELAMGANAISTAAGEAASGVNDVARNVCDVSNTASESSRDACQTKVNARRLTELAGVLQALVGRFHVGEAPFDAARMKALHQARALKLILALEGYEPVGDDLGVDHHECELGRWLESSATREVASVSVFADVCQYHEELHRIASEAAQLISKGCRSEAQSLVDAFYAEERLLSAALDELYVTASRYMTSAHSA